MFILYDDPRHVATMQRFDIYKLGRKKFVFKLHSVHAIASFRFDKIKCRRLPLLIGYSE
jgi:hypothetical protein